MKFSEILKAARNAWGFAWPPIVALAVVFLVADFVSAFSVKNSIMEGLGAIREKMAWIKEVKALLNEYGLAKMVTVFVGVLLVVVLYLVKHVGLSLVGALPPFLGISLPQLLLRMLPDKEVVRLMRRYPGAESFKEAYDWALAEFQASLPKPLEPPDSVGLVASQLTKLAALTAIIVACVSIRSNPGAVLFELLIVLVISALVWFGTAIAVLKAQQQLAQEQWFSFRKNLLTESAKLRVEEISEDELGKVWAEKERARASRWWRLRLADPKAGAWFREHVLGK